MAGQKGMKWSPYKLKKRSLLRDLQKVYGRLKDQSVFPVDDENCQIIKDALEFFQSLDTQHDWYNKRYCPVCKSRKITFADIEPCCFNGANDAKLGKIVGLRVWHCCDCGFLNFCNIHDDYQSEW